MSTTPAEGFKLLLGVLDRFEIKYFIGGSVASSLYGIPRFTMDVDVIAEIEPAQIEDFAAALKSEFYADPETMREAVARGRSFNLIHSGSSHKFDIFPARPDPYTQAQFRRREFNETRSLGEPIECAIASAEDTVLSKLRWYRDCGEGSSRQWDDLRGIIGVSGAKLDLDYLNEWAPRLNVSDLLDRLLNEKR
jgi:hypothetical protein